jgi:signal transduction histidine kinase
VRGDAGKLRQVFTNLVSSSITFTPAGGSVSITAQARDDGGVSVAEPQERKASIAILQELIPLQVYGSCRGTVARELRRFAVDARCTVGTPVPYRMSDLLQLIDEGMGKLENKHRFVLSREEAPVVGRGWDGLHGLGGKAWRG